MNPGLALAPIVFLGAASQWVAWRVGVPAILPLLTAGFFVGSIGGLMHPVDVFRRDVLFSCVSLAVGLILFEGSTTLHFPDVKEVRRITMRLLSIGALISWVGAAVAAYSFTAVSRTLSSSRFSKDFGKENVFQLASRAASEKQTLAEDTRGNLAFGNEVNFDTLEEMFINGATLKDTKLTESFTYDMYLKQHEDAVPLFLRRNGRVEVIDHRKPVVGDAIIAAVRGAS